MTFQKELADLGACEGAVKWVGDQTPMEALRHCKRADWLLWYLGRTCNSGGVLSHQEVVLLACRCARRALRFVPKGETRPALAIAAARRWARNPTEANRAAAEGAAAAGVARAAALAAWVAWAAGAADGATAGAARHSEHVAMCSMIRGVVLRKIKQRREKP